MINQQYVTDLLINAKIFLRPGEAQQMAKVLRQTLDIDGNLVGTFDKKSNLNSLVYGLEFLNGGINHYSANVIAENLWNRENCMCSFFSFLFLSSTLLECFLSPHFLSFFLITCQVLRPRAGKLGLGEEDMKFFFFFF